MDTNIINLNNLNSNESIEETKKYYLSKDNNNYKFKLSKKKMNY